MDNPSDSSQFYLRLAAENGHVLAKRILAIRYMRGRVGLSNIPRGVIMHIRAVNNIIHAVNYDDKIKYTSLLIHLTLLNIATNDDPYTFERVAKSSWF